MLFVLLLVACATSVCVTIQTDAEAVVVAVDGEPVDLIGAYDSAEVCFAPGDEVVVDVVPPLP